MIVGASLAGATAAITLREDGTERDWDHSSGGCVGAIVVVLSLAVVGLVVAKLRQP